MVGVIAIHNIAQRFTPAAAIDLWQPSLPLFRWQSTPGCSGSIAAPVHLGFTPLFQNPLTPERNFSPLSVFNER